MLLNNKQQVEFKITINLDDLLYHLEHRSENKHSIDDFKKFFQENPQELEFFLDECKNLGTDFLKSGLDEFESIINFANKFDLKIKHN